MSITCTIVDLGIAVIGKVTLITLMPDTLSLSFNFECTTSSGVKIQTKTYDITYAGGDVFDEAYAYLATLTDTYADQSDITE